MDGEGESLPDKPVRYRPNSAQWWLAGLIVAFVVGVALFKLIKGAGLGQTAALYIGIPTVLALILTLSAPPGKAVGMMLRAITIFILLSIPVLGEGFVCVLIASPLIYAVGLAVALPIDYLRRRGDSAARIAVIPALALVLSLEGVVPMLTVPGDNSVSATRTVAASPQEIAAALSRPLRFEEVAPSGLLSLGFPRPMMDNGSGLSVGDHRVVMFDGAHHRTPLVAAHHWGEAPSRLEFEVAARESDSVRLCTVSDATPLATWLSWRGADIRWRAVDAGHTEITWTLDYTRRLSPAWYFGPIERVVTQRAAAYLLEALDIRS